MASNDDVRGVPWRMMEHGVMVPPAAPSLITHVAHSLAPEAQAKRQSEAAQALDDAKAQGLGNEAQIRAVLRVLGLST